MKKYVVRNKTTNEVFGKFYTKNEASEKIVKYITEKNDDVFSEEEGFLSIFDFDVQEEEVEEIDSYEDALEFLGIKDIYKSGDIKAVETTPKHYKALSAISKLLTIAEAWNKEDGFVPDFYNENQPKYFPWFEYNKGAAGFVCTGTYWTATDANETGGSLLCFATRERALAFGKKFEELYNDFLLM